MNTLLMMVIVGAVALLGCTTATPKTVRVVGGDTAEKGQFPYQAALTHRGKLLCGAVLVHERFVLTAAHCLYQGDKPLQEKALRVFFGSDRLMMGGQFRRVQAVHKHEQFVQGQYTFDLALVEFNKPVEFSESLSAVTVSETPFEGGEVTFTGWGRTAEGENTSYKLKYNTLTSLGAEDCQGQLEDAYYDGSLCFRGQEEEGGVCFGDYGGPAVHDGTLVGVASYTVGGACGGDKPDVFVDVGVFHEWVQEKLGATNETQ